MWLPLGIHSLSELTSAGFETENIAIKLQHADKSTAFYKDLKNLQIAHEYVLIMRKPNV